MKNIALILDRHDVFDSLISFVIKEKKYHEDCDHLEEPCLIKEQNPRLKKNPVFLNQI